MNESWWNITILGENRCLFEERKVRTVWDDKEEKWYFCVADVVEALTDSVTPTDYIKKMKKRDPELAKGWGQIVTPLSVQTSGGKQRVNCATQQGIFRIIQSIPSKKAEPFKMTSNVQVEKKLNNICFFTRFIVPLQTEDRICKL